MPAPSHAIVFALAAIAIGVLFFLNNLGVAGVHHVARLWPAIPIALGFVLLVDSRTTPASICGGLLIAGASFFLLGNLGILHLAWRMLWPTFPIAFGIVTLVWTAPWRNQGPALHR